MGTETEAQNPRVVIVGAGVSGLCMAIRLKRAGIDDFVILEQSEDVGGTWQKNTYPNAGCDVPSYLYSFSFAPSYDWTMKYARQPEILDYLRWCADRFGIRDHIRFRVTVESGSFDHRNAKWLIKTDSGDCLRADVFISAVGQLNRPNVPDIEAFSNFEGEAWHSARWNHAYDLTDKTVAVIGNGASAIQFVPEIAKDTRRLYLVQRTPSWIEALDNYRYPRWAKWACRTLPGCGRLHRLWIYLMCEWHILAFREGGYLNREYGKRLRRRMRRIVPQDQWSQLIPDYAPGCKRILLSNDYLQALQRDNVEVISEPLERFESDAIVNGDTRRQVDAVIFATGFKANEFLQPMEIRGSNGETLDEAWAGRARAYRGMLVPGFPNLFMLYGPNTNLGHNSIIFMVERQVNYIIRCLKRMKRVDARSIEITEPALEQDDQEVQSRLKSLVWAGSCMSWYKTSDGAIPNNWCGSTLSYWWRVRRPQFSQFHFGKTNECDGPA